VKGFWHDTTATKTEKEWLTCRYTRPMLHYLKGNVSGELRLFATAACRLVWPQLADARSKHAVEVRSGSQMESRRRSNLYSVGASH